MGSREQDIFLDNKSPLRLQTASLRSFARRVHTELRLKGAVAILIASDKELQHLNRLFRGKDAPTDVLSFPSDIRGHAGDIAISGDTAAANAKALKIQVSEEIKILILHGMLHLAGFDHETDNGEMAERELALRRHFRLSQSLIERAHRPVRASVRPKSKEGAAR